VDQDALEPLQIRLMTKLKRQGVVGDVAFVEMRLGVFVGDVGRTRE